MLSIHEFTCGTAEDIESTALLIPSGFVSQKFIVTQWNQKRFAIGLGKEYIFNSFEIDDNEAWSGVIINDIQLRWTKAPFSI